MAQKNNSIQFQCPESHEKFRQTKQLNRALEYARSRKSAPEKHVSVTTPPAIIYQEDTIRELFYCQHPFELDRPVSIVFDENLANVSWSSIHGSPTVPLTGER